MPGRPAALIENDSRLLIRGTRRTADGVTFAYKSHQLADKSYNIKQCVGFAFFLAL